MTENAHPILIGSDHAGYEMKEFIKQYLSQKTSHLKKLVPLNTMKLMIIHLLHSNWLRRSLPENSSVVYFFAVLE